MGEFLSTEVLCVQRPLSKVRFQSFQCPFSKLLSFSKVQFPVKGCFQRLAFKAFRPRPCGRKTSPISKNHTTWCTCCIVLFQRWCEIRHLLLRSAYNEVVFESFAAICLARNMFATQWLKKREALFFKSQFRNFLAETAVLYFSFTQCGLKC